jgi:hypothetical protein
MKLLLNRLRNWLRKSPSPSVIASEARKSDIHSQDNITHVEPYDENLFERSRTQWQFGDWTSLAGLNRNTLQHHPDRAKLSLLAAAGHAQLGDAEQARQYIRLARDWGCSKKLISQVLISGVHNSLARAAAAGGQAHKTAVHFESAIRIGMPNLDSLLMTQARAQQQLNDMGLVDKFTLYAESENTILPMKEHL